MTSRLWTQDSASIVSRGKDPVKEAYESVMMGKTAVFTERDFNEVQEIQNTMRQEMYRAMTHSGVLQVGTILNSGSQGKAGDIATNRNDNLNTFIMYNGTEAIVNGIKLSLDLTTVANRVTLPAPPTFGTREDLVFLEVWKEEVPYDKPTGQYGGEGNTKNANFEDTRATVLGKDQSSRIATKWRIRAVAGVDFSNYKEGMGRGYGISSLGTVVTSQGGNNLPVSDDGSTGLARFWSQSDRDYSTDPNRKIVNDIGLYTAGYNSQQSKDLLKTADGYVYAIPLFRVKRRNSGGYRQDNVNGARDFLKPTFNRSTATDSFGAVKTSTATIDTQVSYDVIKVGDIFEFTDNKSIMFRILTKDGNLTVTYENISVGSTTGIGAGITSTFQLKSDRPDGLYSNIIDKDDIIDLRHKVSLTGFNYQQLLEENFDKLLRGELQTKEKTKMIKERFGLTPAPLGLQQELVPQTIKGGDGTSRDLLNVLVDGSISMGGKYLWRNPNEDTKTRLKLSDGTVKTTTDKFSIGGTDNHPTLSRIANFEGKVSGSTVDNPHKGYRGSDTSLLSPTNLSAWIENDTTFYSNTSKVDGSYFVKQTSTNLQQSQQLFSFDLISEVERKIGTIPRSTTVDKVQWLKDNLSKLTCNWYGYGSSPIGNKANFTAWGVTPSTYDSPSAHVNSVVTKLTKNIAVPSGYIDSNGFVHFLAYAEPSNGTIASTINTDYVELEIEVKATAKFSNTIPYVYSVGDTDFDKINVDANFTGTALDDKFPKVTNYPNLVENIFNGQVELGRWDTTGKVSMTDRVRISDYLSVYPSTAYSVVTAKTLNTICYYDSNKQVIGTPTTLTPIFVTPSNCVYIGVYFTSTDTTNDLRISPLNNFLGYAPYGRWLLPTDYVTGDTPTRLADFANSNHRQTWSDAQMSDVVTDIVDPVKTPQKHITVTQATAGQWSVNDTIKVKADNGVISGVIDSDTALAKVLGWGDGGTDSRTNQTQIKLSTVAGLAVNDTVAMTDAFSGGNAVNTLTITAIDATNNVITFTPAINSTVISNYFIYETTASSSSPVTTATGLVGTWSGLGTKEATFTITTAPTTNTDLIKVQYSINYPSGKGIQNVPSEVLEGKMNGDKLVKASDGIVHVKANFVGKISGNTDLVPHVFKRTTSNAGATTLLSPSSFVNEGDANGYSSITILDGTSISSSTNVNSQYSEQLFSFDIIRAITDKLGDGVFADCLTLADKVAKAKTIVTAFNLNWWGYGSSPTGNKATIVPWRVSNSSWWTAYSVTNLTSTVAKLTAGISNGDQAYLVDSNGFMHFLAYAEPSDGTTGSTINTDYVELELQLNVAEMGYDVLVPENPFPKLVDDPSMFKEGENIVPPFTDIRWNINSSAQVTDGQNLTLNATATYQTSSIVIPIKGGQSYTASIKQITSGARVILTTQDSAGNNVDTLQVWLQNSIMKKTIKFGTNAVKLTLQLDNTVTGVLNYSQLMITPNDNVHQFAQYNKSVKRKKKLDFLGKVAGSTFENPHRTLARATSTFDSPSSFIETTAQSAYDQLSKQDGTLNLTTGATAGQYGQRIFEFDLSHLGLSLTELKSALRKLTVNWTGYGSGDNAGVKTYGVTVKIWNTTGVWDTAGTNISSSPSIVTSVPSQITPRLTNDQKVYILVHSTYPASATNQSEIYTDYINLVVELADYIDYIPCKPVKVRKETKELKLVYPKKSYRTGLEDNVELFYKTIPYQGNNKYDGKTFKFSKNLSQPEFGALTIGTGSPTRLNTADLAHVGNLPLADRSWQYTMTSDDLANSIGATKLRKRIPIGVGTLIPAYGGYTFAEIYRLFEDDYLFSQNSTIYQGSGSRVNGWNASVGFEKLSKVANKLGFMVVVALADDGNLYLVVATSKSSTDMIDFYNKLELTAIDYFILQGRPLIKEGN